ncbi:MAG: hypothetical protein IPG71_14255 [bacterium]|nr:hypothetical protein [bacterium]
MGYDREDLSQPLDGCLDSRHGREFNLSKNTVKRYLRLANKDYQTVLGFLTERGVVSNGDSQLRELLAQFSSRRQTSDRASMVMQ